MLLHADSLSRGGKEILSICHENECIRSKQRGGTTNNLTDTISNPDLVAGTGVRRGVTFTSSLSSMRKEIEKSDIIVIDEGQFFGLEDILFIKDCVINMENKIFLISTLFQTFNTQLFGFVHELLTVADNVITSNYSPLCKCGEVAAYNRKFENNDILVDIGGEEKYYVICKKCDYRERRYGKGVMYYLPDK